LLTGFMMWPFNSSSEKTFNWSATMFWSIWLCRNDVAFNFKPIPSILQVLFRGCIGSDFGDYCRNKKLTKRFLWYVNP
jgi:hypothetical protein